ncbi:MAG: class I SAM-dependent methyltransferase [Terracoccus sp.]
MCDVDRAEFAAHRRASTIGGFARPSDPCFLLHPVPGRPTAESYQARAARVPTDSAAVAPVPASPACCTVRRRRRHRRPRSLAGTGGLRRRVDRSSRRARPLPAPLDPSPRRWGDARQLGHEDRSVDAVLLLGPLYHLPKAGDRQQALREAARVTRAGGLVAAAAIGRYAPLLELAGLGELDDNAALELSSLVATGLHLDDPQGFTSAYFHQPEELAQEMTDAGLLDVLVLCLVID